MNFARKIGVFVILAAMVLFILLQFDIFGGQSNPSNRAEPPVSARNIEPQFQHEGNGWMLSSDGDTLLNIKLELAESREEIEYGMMYRKSFHPERYGMLFFMGQERQQSFWMRNTYVPLDIIYLNDDLEVVSIVHNATPLDETSRPSEGPASHVLELPGSMCISNGIQRGTKLVWEDIR